MLAIDASHLVAFHHEAALVRWDVEALLVSPNGHQLKFWQLDLGSSDTLVHYGAVLSVFLRQLQTPTTPWVALRRFHTVDARSSQELQ